MMLTDANATHQCAAVPSRASDFVRELRNGPFAAPLALRHRHTVHWRRLAGRQRHGYLSDMDDMPPMPAIPLALAALTAGGGSVLALWAYSVFVPGCGFWAPVIRAMPQREAAALTFENGPDKHVTPRVLDILAEAGIKATFFVIGQKARTHPDLIRRIHAAGHAIGNHTLDHPPFRFNRSWAYWQKQIGETQNIVADITGQPPVLFRPPLGYKTRSMAAAAREMRLPMIGWTVRGPATSGQTAEHFAARVLKRTTGHDILLFEEHPDPHRRHAADPQIMLAALPAILRAIPEKKMQIVPLIESLVSASDDYKRAAERRRLRAAEQ